MDALEEAFERLFELLVFGPLVEFADEVAAAAQRVVGEVEGGVAEVL